MDVNDQMRTVIEVGRVHTHDVLAALNLTEAEERVALSEEKVIEENIRRNIHEREKKKSISSMH
jgi:hypothetical protein